MVGILQAEVVEEVAGIAGSCLAPRFGGILTPCNFDIVIELVLDSVCVFLSINQKVVSCYEACCIEKVLEYNPVLAA